MEKKSKIVKIASKGPEVAQIQSFKKCDKDVETVYSGALGGHTGAKIFPKSGQNVLA